MLKLRPSTAKEKILKKKKNPASCIQFSHNGPVGPKHRTWKWTGINALLLDAACSSNRQSLLPPGNGDSSLSHRPPTSPIQCRLKPLGLAPGPLATLGRRRNVCRVLHLVTNPSWEAAQGAAVKRELLFLRVTAADGARKQTGSWKYHCWRGYSHTSLKGPLQTDPLEKGSFVRFW